MADEKDRIAIEKMKEKIKIKTDKNKLKFANKVYRILKKDYLDNEEMNVVANKIKLMNNIKFAWKDEYNGLIERNSDYFKEFMEYVKSSEEERKIKNKEKECNCENER